MPNIALVPHAPIQVPPYLEVRFDAVVTYPNSRRFRLLCYERIAGAAHAGPGVAVLDEDHHFVLADGWAEGQGLEQRLLLLSHLLEGPFELLREKLQSDPLARAQLDAQGALAPVDIGH